MKSVNRKVLLTLLGVVVATPFLLIGLLLGAHAAAVVENVKAEVFVIALVFVSAAAGIAHGNSLSQANTERNPVTSQQPTTLIC